MDLEAKLAEAAEANINRQYVKARQTCDQILTAANLPPPTAARAGLLKSRALCRGALGLGEEALITGLDAILQARISSDALLLSECLVQTMEAALFTGRYDIASELAEELRGPTLPPRGQAHGFNTLGWLHLLNADYGQAAKAYRQAVQADPSFVKARHGLATVELLCRRPGRTLQLVWQGRELTDTNNLYRQCRGLLLAGAAKAEMADFPAATKDLGECRRLAEHLGSDALMAGYHLVVSQTALQGHAPAEAKREAELALAAARRAQRLDLHDLISRLSSRITDQEQWPGNGFDKPISTS